MSVKLNWTSVEEHRFTSWVSELLTSALNSKEIPILASRISVLHLDLGSSCPDLEILEIGECASDRFRGIFKFTYDGDAEITLHTKVQANPLNIYEKTNFMNNDSNLIMPEFILSSAPLAIPLNLTLSNIKMSAITVAVFNKTKGLTLVFKNDPLESIKVSSTFDMIPFLANFLQSEIEKQIRNLFRDVLPTILHRLSQKYTTNGGIINLHDHLLQIQDDDFKNQQQLQTQNDFINEYDISSLNSTNLLKMQTIMASNRTLSLFTPNIKDVVNRSNIDKFNKHLLINNNLDFKINKFLTPVNNNNNESINNGNGNDKESIITGSQLYGIEKCFEDIVKIQSRNYYRTNSSNKKEKKPKRRVINLKHSKSKSSLESSTSSNSMNSQSNSTTIQASSMLIPINETSITVNSKPIKQNENISNNQVILKIPTKLQDEMMIFSNQPYNNQSILPPIHEKVQEQVFNLQLQNSQLHSSVYENKEKSNNYCTNNNNHNHNNNKFTISQGIRIMSNNGLPLPSLPPPYTY